jgi:hypothetical protein
MTDKAERISYIMRETAIIEAGRRRLKVSRWLQNGLNGLAGIISVAGTRGTISSTVGAAAFGVTAGIATAEAYATTRHLNPNISRSDALTNAALSGLGKVACAVGSHVGAIAPDVVSASRDPYIIGAFVGVGSSIVTDAQTSAYLTRTFYAQHRIQPQFDLNQATDNQ